MKFVSFASDLCESGISPIHHGRGKLLSFTGRDDVVVRCEHFRDLKHKYDGSDPRLLAECGERLYRELDHDYGINAPVEFAISADHDGCVYAVVDRICGKDLQQAEPTAEVAAEADRLYGKIASYYLSKLREGGMYLADINTPSQYVYGTRKGADVPGVYLVDTDLYIRNDRTDLLNIVVWFCRHMFGLEDRMGRKFVQARGIVREIADTPLSDSQEYAMMVFREKIRGYLSESIPIGDDPHPLFRRKNVLKV